MKGVIYKYTSPSGKSYIGQTINEHKRKLQHKYNSSHINSKYYYLPFYVAIRKYGFDSFNYEILYTIISDDINEVHKILDNMEIYYIGQYNSYYEGYNCTIGGSTPGSGSTHPSYGRKLSERHKLKLKQSVSRTVWQFDLEGNFIKEYSSAAQAERETGCDASQIIYCVINNKGTSKGFQWRAKDTYPGKYCPSKKKISRKYGKENKRSKIVDKYSLDGILIESFDCLMDITRKYNYNSGTICHAIHNQKPYKNYIWKYR